MQYQAGSALKDHAVSPTGTQHLITFQHASGWSLGENFFFVDMACCKGAGGANRDIYMEWYPFLSLGAITGKDTRIEDADEVLPQFLAVFRF